MSDKYTYADVIIDPNDPRVEIGKEYYFEDTAMEVLELAQDNVGSSILEEIYESDNFPFKFKGVTDGYACLIRKKEPAKKYVPFDLTKEEDRARLRGAWVREKDSGRECSITGLFLDEKPPYVEISDEGYSSEYLLENYEFVDGTPCGKLVEEE